MARFTIRHCRFVPIGRYKVATFPVLPTDFFFFQGRMQSPPHTLCFTLFHIIALCHTSLSPIRTNKENKMFFVRGVCVSKVVCLRVPMMKNPALPLNEQVNVFTIWLSVCAFFSSFQLSGSRQDLGGHQSLANNRVSAWRNGSLSRGVSGACSRENGKVCDSELREAFKSIQMPKGI